MVSLRPNRPGNLFIIITACRTTKYQNYRPTCFYVMNARVIWIKVRHVRSDNLFKDWLTEEAAIVLESLDNIHWRSFPPINFLSKSELNMWGRHPASDLNCSSAKVIDVDDSEDILYIQQYLVAISTRSRSYR